MESCSSCHFSRFADPKNPSALAMWCCKNPPKPFLVAIANPLRPGAGPEPQVQSFFAPTRGDNWCGEWKPLAKTEEVG